MSRRDTSLDIIAGFLILRMILGHCSNWWPGIYQEIWGKLFFFSMPWFFYKSGMFVRARTVKEEIKFCHKRLLIPFITFGSIGIILQISLDFLTSHTLSIEPFIKTIKILILEGTAYGNEPLWFIFTLIITKILYSLISQKISTVAIGFIFGGLAWLFSLYLPYPQYFGNTCCALFFYSAGHCLKKIQYNKGVFILSLITWLVIFVENFSSGDMKSNNITGNYLLYLLSSTGGIISINNIVRKVNHNKIGITTIIIYFALIIYYISNLTSTIGLIAILLATFVGIILICGSYNLPKLENFSLAKIGENSMRYYVTHYLFHAPAIVIFSIFNMNEQELAIVWITMCIVFLPLINIILKQRQNLRILFGE